MKVGDNLQNDELKIYRGEDFVVSKYIKIHQPSLSEICDYGEQEYYSMIYHLTATPQTMKVQLWDMEPRIDYTKITPYELFYNILYRLFPKEKTSIIFGDLDFTKFQIMQRKDNGDILLCQFVNDEQVIIDEFTYNLIMDYLRQVHGEEFERNKNKDHPSQLVNLISSMVNSEGFKYNHSQIWDMKINAFMDSVKRISKIKNAELLLQSGYSGFGINLKDIDQKQLDWLGELK